MQKVPFKSFHALDELKCCFYVVSTWKKNYFVLIHRYNKYYNYPLYNLKVFNKVKLIRHCIIVLKK